MRTALAALALIATPATATSIADPAGDLLPSYTGEPRPSLDVLGVQAVYFPNVLRLSARFAGAIPRDFDQLYVWGVNRGAGTPGLTAGTPPLGSGIDFDAVVVARANGTGFVVTFGAGAPVTTSLVSEFIIVSGSTLRMFVPLDLLPSTGFAVADYGYNLWPRLGLGSNTQIADFAPDNATFTATAVPEPTSWAMLIAGFGVIGGAARRRRRAAPA